LLHYSKTKEEIMRKLWVLWSIIIIAIIILLAVTLPKKENKEIEIGVIASLTGSIAPYGERLVEGAELAVEETNKKDGISSKYLKLIIEDSKSTPGGAVSAMKKLANVNKVSVVIGVIGSSLAMAIAPIAEKNKVVLMSTGASTPDYTNAGDYCFRNRPSAEQEVKKMAEVAFKTLGFEEIAILYVNNDYGRSYKDIFFNHFKRMGGQIPYSESFAQGSTDIRTQLTKVKNVSPGAIYLIGQALENAYAVKQARELGINTQILGTIGVEAGNFLEIAGEAAEGIIYTAASYNPESRDPAVRHFEKLYRAKYNKSADLFAATAYDAIKMLAEIIKNVGYNADNIKDELYNVKNFYGASGLTTFDKNGDVIKPIAIKKIKNRKFVYLDEDLSEVK